MKTTTKKSVNWLVERFTSIDLASPQPKTKHKKSTVQLTCMVGGKQTAQYQLSETVYDNEGRPHRVRTFDEEGTIVEQEQYHYNQNEESLHLFEDEELLGSIVQKFTEKGAILSQCYQDQIAETEEITTYKYDEKGRLIKVTQKEEPLNDAPADPFLEPLQEIILQWDGDRLLALEDREEGEIVGHTMFEYDENGQVQTVNYKALDEDALMLSWEQIPSFDQEGRMQKNLTVYTQQDCQSELLFRYWYDEETGELTKMLSKQSTDGILDEQRTHYYNADGDLIKLEDGYHGNKDVDVKEYLYE